MNAKSAAESISAAYFDTSALVKRYVRESGSDRVRRLLHSRAVVSSAVIHVEAVSSVRRRLREGRLSSRSAGRILQRIEEDVAFWWLAPVSEQVLSKARSLILGSAARTLDAIHVASASLLVGEGLTMPFVTADRRQAEVAGVAGLEVIEIGR